MGPCRAPGGVGDHHGVGGWGHGQEVARSTLQLIICGQVVLRGLVLYAAFWWWAHVRHQNLGHV